MKATKLTYLLVIAVALTFASTGCRKRPVGITDIPGRGAKVGDPGPKGPNTGIAVPPDQGLIADAGPGGGEQSSEFSNPDNFNQDRAALAAHTVHFDLDSSVVKSSEKANVEAAAAYMKANPPTVGLLIEGNCDERGTEEYNRALGERRALAIRELIVASGVEARRVVTVSYGEDKPEALGHDEAAWAINRRGVFVVLHPK